MNGFEGQIETNPNPIHSATDSAYSTMHPVMKNPPQPPPKPVVVQQQPRKEVGIFLNCFKDNLPSKYDVIVIQYFIPIGRRTSGVLDKRKIGLCCY